MAEEDRHRVTQSIKEAFQTGHSIQIEATLINQQGGRVPYYLIGRLLEEEGERYVIALGMDISDKKRLESELMQAQKMEAIGTLAGGIAHDFNNILSSIFGNVDLALLKTDNNSPSVDHLQGIQRAARRARDLVGQILTFSRKREIEKKQIQPSVVVREVLNLIRSSLPSTIKIKSEIASDSRIYADPTQIHQVVMNICTNAYHAMQNTGGQLTVGLKDVSLHNHGDRIVRQIPKGNYVCIEISDSGVGMDIITREKIFEPYFTTKEHGSGTGLGLAVVHGIIKAHDGHIMVYSELGKGTTFRILFPSIYESSIEDTEAETGALPRGSERILLVDDEKDIADACAELLHTQGFSVTRCLDSEEAINIFSRDPQGVDLVITDLTMPKMTGCELAQEMLGLRPNLPIIICSGFAEQAKAQEILAAGVKGYLSKPVEGSVLLQEIRRILDS